MRKMVRRLDETVIEDRIINALADKLMSPKKELRKVVFVGVERKDKVRIKKAFKEANFVMDFINDFEKAKEWLIESC